MIDAVLWGICGIVAALLYWGKGHRGAPALTLSLLFGPLGILMAALTPPSGPEYELEAMAASDITQPAVTLQTSLALSVYGEHEAAQVEPATA